MENNNINLLDLNNDVLNIIGEYVKEDNKKEKRKKEKEFIFKGMDRHLKFLIRTNDFNHKQINKLISDMIHDGVLTLEECTEYAYRVKERKCNGLD